MHLNTTLISHYTNTCIPLQISQPSFPPLSYLGQVKLSVGAAAALPPGVLSWRSVWRGTRPLGSAQGGTVVSPAGAAVSGTPAVTFGKAGQST